MLWKLLLELTNDSTVKVLAVQPWEPEFKSPELPEMLGGMVTHPLVILNSKGRDGIINTNWLPRRAWLLLIIIIGKLWAWLIPVINLVSQYICTCACAPHTCMCHTWIHTHIIWKWTRKPVFVLSCYFGILWERLSHSPNWPLAP